MQGRVFGAALVLIGLAGGTLAAERPPPLRLQQDVTVTLRPT